MKTSILRLLATTALVAASSAYAGPIYFSDNFDGSPYTDNAALVTGTGQLAHGYWGKNNTGTGQLITSTSASLSSPRSLSLDPGVSGYSQATGIFSTDGTNVTTVTSAYTLEFSFMKTATNVNTHLYIGGSGANQPVSLYAENGNFYCYFNNVPVNLYSGVAANTWYNVKLDVGASTGGSDYYTAKIYNTSNTLLGTQTGLFNKVSTNSQYFVAYLSTADAHGGTFYLDNISAVPEPGTSALLLLGVAATGLGAMRRKSSRR